MNFRTIPGPAAGVAAAAAFALLLAGHAHATLLTLDSLVVEDLPRATLAATDINVLSRLRREVEYSANSFRRYLGSFPPKIGVAAVGNVSPARIDAALLRTRGIEFVLTDWPERSARAGVAPPPAVGTALSERVSRWYLRAYEKATAKGTPPAGKARFTPDWFETAIAGLAAMPAEQSRRVEWMRARLDQRVPFAKFLEMARPAEKGVAAKPAARRSAARLPTAELFDAQAIAFARFLNEREGERFIGLAYERILAGEPQSAAFNIAKTLLPHPEVLEKEWVAWMKEKGVPPVSRDETRSRP